MWCSKTHCAVIMGHQTISPSQLPSSAWRSRSRSAASCSAEPASGTSASVSTGRCVRIGTGDPEGIEVRKARASASVGRAAPVPPARLTLYRCHAARNSQARRLLSPRATSRYSRQSFKLNDLGSLALSAHSTVVENSRLRLRILVSSQPSNRIVRPRTLELARQRLYIAWRSAVPSTRWSAKAS